MKKVLFSLLLGAVCIAVACVFSSCNGKKEVQKVGQYELLEQNGKFGLKDSTGHVVLAAEYDKITERPGWYAVVAEKGNLSSIVVNGYVVADQLEITSFEPIDDTDFIYIKCPNSVRIWKKGTSSLVGPFSDIKLIDDILFLNDEGKWGAATVDHVGLAPRKFDKIIIAKNDKTFAVLVKDAKGWSMFDKDGVSNGVRYDTPSKVLEKQIKPLNIDGDIAVVKVNWPL
jgi:hypothetical protein